MSQASLFSLAGVALLVLGLHALIAHAHLLRKILALNVMGNGVFLMTAALAWRSPELVDPIPDALVITGIVVAVAATALALSLMLKLRRETGSPSLPDQPLTPIPSKTEPE